MQVGDLTIAYETIGKGSRIVAIPGGRFGMDTAGVRVDPLPSLARKAPRPDGKTLAPGNALFMKQNSTAVVST